MSRIVDVLGELTKLGAVKPVRLPEAPSAPEDQYSRALYAHTPLTDVFSLPVENETSEVEVNPEVEATIAVLTEGFREELPEIQPPEKTATEAYRPEVEAPVEEPTGDYSDLVVLMVHKLEDIEEAMSQMRRLLTQMREL